MNYLLLQHISNFFLVRNFHKMYMNFKIWETYAKLYFVNHQKLLAVTQSNSHWWVQLKRVARAALGQESCPGAVLSTPISSSHFLGGTNVQIMDHYSPTLSLYIRKKKHYNQLGSCVSTYLFHEMSMKNNISWFINNWSWSKPLHWRTWKSKYKLREQTNDRGAFLSP